MKHIFTFIACLSVVFIGNCQTNTTINAQYQYSNFGLGKTTQTLLSVNGGKSVFRFLEEVKENSVFTDNEGVPHFSISLNDSTGKWVFKNANDTTLIFRDILYLDGKPKPILVKETLPKMNWTLLKENDTINNLLCSKAETSFRGRKYVAWYSEEIPLNNGPWKFHNLPGLIVKVRSKDGIISFTLTAIEYSDKPVSMPTFSDEYISLEEYAKRRENQIDEFIRRLYSKLPRASSITVTSTGDYNLETEF